MEEELKMTASEEPKAGPKGGPAERTAKVTQKDMEERAKGASAKAPKEEPEKSPRADAKDDIEREIREEEIVFDYYEASDSHVLGSGYYEFVLYKRDGEGLILAKYSKWRTDSETMRACIVPESFLDDCMSEVEKYNVTEWKAGVGIPGKRYVIRFRKGEDFFRVTSDMMPKGGENVFGAVKGILASAWKEYGPVEEYGGKEADKVKTNIFIGIGMPDEYRQGPYFDPGTERPGESWNCPGCGSKNDGSYCKNCGLSKPKE